MEFILLLKGFRRSIDEITSAPQLFLLLFPLFLFETNTPFLPIPLFRRSPSFFLIFYLRVYGRYDHYFLCYLRHFLQQQ